MIAGKEQNIEFKVKKGAGLDLTLGKEWNLAILKIQEENDELVGNLCIKPELSGEYQLKKIDGIAKSRFGFMVKNNEIGTNLSIKVYPRVFPWIIYSIGLLEKGGWSSFGNNSSRRKGLGLEYYGTREYFPGDSFRFIDWKATARLGRFMVKEFLDEQMNSTHVIYDRRSLGFITKDENAAVFLSTLLGLVEKRIPFSLTIKSGAEIMFYDEEMDPFEAVRVGLAHVLEEFSESEFDFYQTIDPRPIKQVIRILKRTGNKGMVKIAREKMRLYNNKVLKRFKNIEEKFFVKYIGSIIHDSEFIINLAGESRARGHVIEVLTSPKPWRDAENMEHAYAIFESYNRIIASLRKSGIIIGMKPTDISRLFEKGKGNISLEATVESAS